MIITNKSIMKNRFKLLILSAFAAFTANAQQGVVWEPEIPVADGSVYGNIRPRIALSDGDNPVVVFGKSTGGKIFTARLNGTAFGTPVELLPAGETSYHASWTGPDIAAHGNTVVVVYKAEPYATANVYTVRSTDGGITFSDTIRADSHDAGQTWMPALTMDDNGNPIVTYMTFDSTGGEEGIAVVKSLDGGLSYQAQINATTGAPGIACDCCSPEILSSGAYQMVLYRNNESNIRDGHAALSEDDGATFTSTANMDNLGWDLMSCPSTGVHGTIIGDSAYVVSGSKGGGPYRVYVSSVGLAGGLNVESVLMMDPPTSGSGDTQNYPRISGKNDTIVMVWEERESFNLDIKIAVATDGLVETLTSFKSRVNANPIGTQAKPDVVYSNGFVHVVYQDYPTGDVIYRKGMITDIADIEEHELSNVTVSPNPAQGLVVVSGIEYREIKDVKLINTFGESIQCKYQVIDNSVIVSLEELESTGVYFIEVVLGSAIYKERIVVVE
jgi:hypothetical protein